MASARFSILVVVAILLPSAALAADYVVGDDKGWTVDQNYTQWASGKTFYVGDNLVFNYDKSKHNVFKIQTADAFKSCEKPDPKLALTSGSDVIPLGTSGKKWYISGVDHDCTVHHMKLAINVWEDESPAPSPIPIPGAQAPAPSAAFTTTAASSWIAAAVAAIIAFAV